MHQIVCLSSGGAYSTLPDPLAGLGGAAPGKGKEGGEGKRVKGRGKRGGKKRGRDFRNAQIQSW